METAFTAVAECVEEAIYNSMTAADRVTGFNGKEPVTVRALNEFLPEALTRARTAAGGR
jgi:L-aminopeptidase/D-esterase-like protein